MDSRTLIAEVRDDLRRFRDPGLYLNDQLAFHARAEKDALAFIAKMGHADVNTAQRLARMLIDA